MKMCPFTKEECKKKDFDCKFFDSSFSENCLIFASLQKINEVVSKIESIETNTENIKSVLDDIKFNS